MAVSVDAAAVRAAAGGAEYAAGEELLAAGAVSGLEAGYGGVNADVAEAGAGWQVWAGVVGRELTGECDCPAAGAAALCRHAVAAALAAVRAGLTWTALAEDEDGAADPEERRLRALAERLPAGELVALLVRQALRDDAVAAELEAAAVGAG
jgi:uncharacterized Zn finger protein